MSREREGSNFLEGLLIGAILGGLLGVLFAPQSGEKSRAWLKKVKDENQDVIDSAVETSENLISSSKSAIKDGFDKIASMIEEKLPEAKRGKKGGLE